MDYSEFGKPVYRKSSIPSELIVLGAMMIDAEKIDEVAGLLESSDFEEPAHGDLLNCMKSMRERGISVDVVSLLDETTHFRQPGYLTACMEHADGVIDLKITHHIDIILRESKRRKHIAWLMESLKEADSADDVDLVISKHQSDINTVDIVSKDSRPELIGHAELRVYERICQQRETGITPGIPTGFKDFDEFTGGMHEGDLFILAGRPGMGKTALALHIARCVAMEDYLTIMFSIEMPIDQLALRRISSGAEIDHTRLRKAQVSDYEVDNMLGVIEDSYLIPLYIDSDATVTVSDLYSRCRKISGGCRDKPLGLVVVDYLQKIKASDRVTDNRTLDVGNAARGMKTLARQLKVPVIALAQINRMAEGRQDKRPMISDLGESGAIEAEADLITMLYRESYYGPSDGHRGLNSVDEVELIVGKARNGRVGTVKVGFEGQFVRFSNLDRPGPGEPTGF